jgi:AraC-like DNA-binding protein
MLEDPDTRPSVTMLARELDLHPVYLARRFRQAFGVSIREYWTIRMVRRASELVVSTA